MRTYNTADLDIGSSSEENKKFKEEKILPRKPQLALLEKLSVFSAGDEKTLAILSLNHFLENNAITQEDYNKYIKQPEDYFLRIRENLHNEDQNTIETCTDIVNSRRTSLLIDRKLRSNNFKNHRVLKFSRCLKTVCGLIHNDNPAFFKYNDQIGCYPEEIYSTARLFRQIGVFQLSPFFYPYDAVLYWCLMNKLTWEELDSVASELQCSPSKKSLNPYFSSLGNVSSIKKDIDTEEVLFQELSKVSPDDKNKNHISALRSIVTRILTIDREILLNKAWKDKKNIRALRELYFKDWIVRNEDKESAEPNLNQFFNGKNLRVNRRTILYFFWKSPHIDLYLAQQLLYMYRMPLLYPKANNFEKDLFMLLQARADNKEDMQLENSLNDLFLAYLNCDV